MMLLKRSWDYLILFFILIYAVYTRSMYGLDFTYSHMDYYIYLHYILHDPPGPLGISYPSAHPFLFFSLGHLAYYTILGENYELLRLLSLIPSLFTVITSYVLGRVLISRVAGIYLAIIVAFSPSFAYLSFELRQTTLFIFFQTLAAIYLVLFLKNRKKQYLYLQIFFLILASLTHFSAIFLIASSYFTILLCYNKKTASLYNIALIANALIGVCLFAYAQTNKHFRHIILDPLYYLRRTKLQSHRDYENLLDYFFFNGDILLLISLIGMLLLVIHKKRILITAILSGIGLYYLVIKILHLYPDTYSRHSSYAFPFLFIPSAYLFSVVLQYILNMKSVMVKVIITVTLSIFSIIYLFNYNIFNDKLMAKYPIIEQTFGPKKQQLESQYRKFDEAYDYANKDLIVFVDNCPWCRNQSIDFYLSNSLDISYTDFSRKIYKHKNIDFSKYYIVACPSQRQSNKHSLRKCIKTFDNQLNFLPDSKIWIFARKDSKYNQIYRFRPSDFLDS